ncbi:hypothetical protein [Enterococcus sp. HY326]|uniref:hypothetical protein n=1 Tax=Enterococcus sp. HY326 TaxID=2971265 RepID=UPI00223EE777|nr:hypothetical protein [Enterococcus sp. HY326]
MTGNVTYELLDYFVDFDGNKSSFVLANEAITLSNVKDSWSVNVEYWDASEGNQQVKILQGQDHYTYVYMDDLPNQLEVIRVTVPLTMLTQDYQNQIVVSRSDLSSSSVPLLTQQQVNEKSVEHSILFRNTVIEERQTMTGCSKKSIEEYQVSIDDLRSNLEVETEKQQTETSTQIRLLEGEIRQEEQSQAVQETQLEEYQLQIVMLQEKLKTYK